MSAKRVTPHYSFAKSPQRNALSLFAHGCCVPASTLLWLIIVLFIFAVVLLMFCCSTITFLRWQYRRTIRNKCDVLREKYDKENRAKREADLKMKEIALRPVQTHHFHQNERTRRDERQKNRSQMLSPENAKSPRLINYGIGANQFNTGNLQLPDDDDNKNALCEVEMTQQKPRSPLRPPAAPSIVASSGVMARSSTVKPSNVPTTISKSSVQPQYTSSDAPVACSTTHPTTTEPMVEVKVEPQLIATTSHAIVAGGWKGVETRPIYPGLILLDKDKSKRGSCPTDRELLITSAMNSAEVATSTNDLRKMDGQSSTTANTNVFESLVGQISSSHSLVQIPMRTKTKVKKEKTGKRRSKSSDSTDEKKRSKVGMQAPRKRSEEHIKSRTKDSQQQFESGISSSSVPSTKSFFPFWTCRRQHTSVVHPTYSPSSGKTCGAKALTSEKSIWTQSSIPSGEMASTTSGDVGMSESLMMPISGVDVYTMRKQMDRLKYTITTAATTETTDATSVDQKPNLPPVNSSSGQQPGPDPVQL